LFIGVQYHLDLIRFPGSWVYHQSCLRKEGFNVKLESMGNFNKTVIYFWQVLNWTGDTHESSVKCSNFKYLSKTFIVDKLNRRFIRTGHWQ